MWATDFIAATCNRETAALAVLSSRSAGFGPTPRAPIVTSRREDHFPCLESGHRLVFMIAWSAISRLIDVGDRFYRCDV